MLEVMGAKKDEGSSQTPEFHTIEEVAQILRCAKSTVREMIAENQLRGTRVRREWRISREALLTFIDAGGCAGHDRR
ncbi:MAG: helix-turn-helix domain-containing protein [bacterium]|nr:helix-turn-helix domain-containing protein [bacterium]